MRAKSSKQRCAPVATLAGKSNVAYLGQIKCFCDLRLTGSTAQTMRSGWIDLQRFAVEVASCLLLFRFA